MRLLDIEDLDLDLPDGRRLLHGISLHVDAGETVGLVGESGSGKSLTSRAILGLLPDRATTGGSIRVDGLDPLAAGGGDLAEIRRRRAAMVFQDPRSGVNPVRRLGDHLTESLRLTDGMPRHEADERAIALLEDVRMPDPAGHLRQYPHELSGGMLQRVMIAAALSGEPRLLLCDEPTTALDVTTQAGIVSALADQVRERGMGMVFVTHDLNLAASLCDRVVVMRAGRVVETGEATRVLERPEHEYTRHLVAATPSIDATGTPRASVTVNATTGSAGADDLALEVSGLSKTYDVPGRAPVTAVSGVDLELPQGAALAVVGESGSGKSTVARMIVGLERPDEGRILIAGADRTIRPRGRAGRLAHARAVQMVFQDPYLSLDPRIPVGRAVEDALRLHRPSMSSADARSAVEALLDQVGLSGEHAEARPRTLSGGQRQRAAIARALAVEPELLVMDEATSALDVSVQAQVLDLIARLREERGLTVLFIGHDLAVVRQVCELVVVMRRGEIVERGRTDEVLSAPTHEYTRLLLDSVPRPGWDFRAAAAAGSEARRIGV